MVPTISSLHCTLCLGTGLRGLFGPVGLGVFSRPCSVCVALIGSACKGVFFDEQSGDAANLVVAEVRSLAGLLLCELKVVERCASVSDLKEIVQQRTGIMITEQELVCGREVLANPDATPLVTTGPGDAAVVLTLIRRDVPFVRQVSVSADSSHLLRLPPRNTGGRQAAVGGGRSSGVHRWSLRPTTGQTRSKPVLSVGVCSGGFDLLGTPGSQTGVCFAYYASIGFGGYLRRRLFDDEGFDDLKAGLPGARAFDHMEVELNCEACTVTFSVCFWRGAALEELGAVGGLPEGTAMHLFAHVDGQAGDGWEVLS